MVKGTFAAALGITSPSSVFRGYGNDVILGFIDGLRAQFPHLKAALDEMLAVISASQPHGPGNISASGGYQWTGTGYELAGRISEDDPRWDWRTMGNRMRGDPSRPGELQVPEGRWLPREQGGWPLRVSPSGQPYYSPHEGFISTADGGWAAIYHRGGISPKDAFLPLIRRDEMVLDPDLSRFVQDAAAMAASPVGSPLDYKRLGDEVARALREQPPTVRVDAMNKARYYARRSHS